eukprot:TRINITY_DN5029_c0_g1_i2.p1 TRINITY_DN5029_c0_g1~~TRINITY_DN5029_c0_g1_i2.p1  ORF type:complete len:224 (-),score=71.94 TRINITY_DN5029_c0_g1_i2:647-1318(-)
MEQRNARAGRLHSELSESIASLQSFCTELLEKAKLFDQVPSDIVQEQVKREERNRETVMRLKKQNQELSACLDALLSKAIAESNGNGETERLARIVLELESRLLAKAEQEEAHTAFIAKITKENSELRLRLEGKHRSMKEAMEHMSFEPVDNSEETINTLRELIERNDEELAKTKIQLAKSIEGKRKYEEELRQKEIIITELRRKVEEVANSAKVCLSRDLAD